MPYRFLLLSALLAFPLAGLAADASSARDARQALHAFLDAPEHAGTRAAVDRTTGTPTIIRADKRPLAVAKGGNHAARVQAAKAFFRQQRALLRLSDPERELELSASRSDTLDQHHYLFQQQLDGVPVHGANLRAHFNASGELRALMARTVPTPADIDTSPVLNGAEALRIASEQFAGARIEMDAPLLEIRSLDDRWHLVYTVQTFVNTVNRWQTVIDAHDGSVLRHHLDHHEHALQASGKGLDGAVHAFPAWHERYRYHLVDTATYPAQLQGYAARGSTYVVDYLGTEGSSTRIVSNDAAHTGWDPAAVSAMVHGQTAFRYFRDTHGHHGTDGNNATTLIGIHYGEQYDNAFWNGKWMVFGDGKRKFSNLAGCLDLVGHEMAHGVIQHTAGLKYENQSGALNESFADLFGVMIDRDDWTIAENCTLVSPGHLRDMADPHNGRRQQPRHMSEYVVRENTKEGDWGGVHMNSGIPNRAAYLLIEGLSVEGMGESIGRAKAEKLYYRALSTYLLPLSQFIDLRRALLLAAEDLFPGDASVERAVKAAFDAVGIVEDATRLTPEGALTFSPGKIEFGEVAVGDRRHATLELFNDSDTAIGIREVRVDDEDFLHSFSAAVLRPGERLGGRVSFVAESAGRAEATLIVIMEDGHRFTVPLFARGVERDASAIAAAAGGGGALLWLLAFLPAAARRRR